jgi:hypothetical protein
MVASTATPTLGGKREATYPPALVNVLDVSSESMAAFQVFLYGRFWVFTEVQLLHRAPTLSLAIWSTIRLQSRSNSHWEEGGRNQVLGLRVRSLNGTLLAQTN